MRKIFLLVMFALLYLSAHAQQAVDTRVFEMRIYYAESGKLDALVQRFQKHTVKLFKKHGMENIGYWLPIQNDKNRLIYVLAYPDMAAREASWKAFLADPKWQKAQKKSELNGALIQKIESIFMKATDFSPAIVPSKGGERVFELRSYTAAPGKLENILARFRNHTTALFAKHGATNLPYWTTLEDKAQPKLIYLLAHRSEAAGKTTFENFRNDPAWIKVKTESEAAGPIVESIESIYMKALPFSKIK